MNRFLMIIFILCLTVFGLKAQTYSLNFDGSGDYVSFSPIVPYSSTMTLEAWVKIVLPSGYNIPEPNIISWSGYNNTAEFRSGVSGVCCRQIFHHGSLCITILANGGMMEPSNSFMKYSEI